MIDAFNVIAGIVTISSLFLSLWIYMNNKKKEDVEIEKANSTFKKLNDLSNTANAISNQALLIAQLTDREETSKKELKHLIISLLATVDVIKKNLNQEVSSKEKWAFGVPTNYFIVKSNSDKKNIKPASHSGASHNAEPGGAVDQGHSGPIENC
jgi:molecular chaperone GrpE (heat shock protein)